MTLMLADFEKKHYLHFWAEGCRPALVQSRTPVRKWSEQEKKIGPEIVEFQVYEQPTNSFAPEIPGDLVKEVREKCYKLYLRTYFRQQRQKYSWNTVGWT